MFWSDFHCLGLENKLTLGSMSAILSRLAQMNGAAPPAADHVVVLEDGERYAMRGSSRVRLCWFKRAGQHCMEPALDTRESLCSYHASGGCSVDETSFYSVRTGQFLSTRTSLPENLDIKGDRLDDIALFGGGGGSGTDPEASPAAEADSSSGKRSRVERGQFRKCCRSCWTFRRAKSWYCVRHNKTMGQSESRRNAKPHMACRFFDLLMQQKGLDIIHRHVRSDGVPVGEELKIRIHKDRQVSVDGYVPDQNLILEFLGDFIHGNPRFYRPWHMNALTKTTFGQLYEETLSRHQAIAALGYTVMYIWEGDFKDYLRQPAGRALWDLLQLWHNWPELPAEPAPMDLHPQVASVVSEDERGWDEEEEEEDPDGAEATPSSSYVIKAPRLKTLESSDWAQSPAEEQQE